MRQSCFKNTVKPLLSGTPLSGHPVLSGQFPKSRIESHINHTNVTFNMRTPLLSGRGHLYRYKPIPNPCVQTRTAFSLLILVSNIFSLLG